ncbi:MAG: AAA family ATPase [Dongiaceae bacterium]
MPTRLREFEVTGLFNQFNHRIPLNIEHHITAILAPNGLGKTVCLKLIEAFFNKRFSLFRDTIFRTLTFSFTSGEVVVVKRNETTRTIKLRRSNEIQKIADIEISYRAPNGTTEKWTPKQPAIPAHRYDLIDRFVPNLSRSGPHTWTDDYTGEELSIDDVLEQYGAHLPEAFSKSGAANEPPQFQALVSSTECHLIETQRLLNLASQASESTEFYEHRVRSRDRSRLAVTQKAEKLVEIIRGTLTESANLSQTLDRTFPRRVVENRGQGKLSQNEIQLQLNNLDDKRKNLMQLGILDTSFESVAIHVGNIEKDVAKVLEIYIEDTSKKLRVFDLLLNRVSLFQELVNERFLNKRINIERKTGYRLISDRDDDIPLDKLSSGEQHRLILLFELLFEVQRNSLILIDEPELSLHVSWQKSFLDDIDRIIRLNDFDVILATHSPQLIGRRYNNLSVELAPVE